MNMCRECALSFFISVIMTLPGQGADTESNGVKYSQWTWPVASLTGASVEQVKCLNELKHILEIKWDVMLQQANPGCCLWVDVLKWKPNPGDDGYIIFIQGGGGWIQATNLKQLLLATERIRQSVVKKDSKVYLPEGILTNYPVIALPHPQAVDGK